MGFHVFFVCVYTPDSQTLVKKNWGKLRTRIVRNILVEFRIGYLPNTNPYSYTNLLDQTRSTQNSWKCLTKNTLWKTLRQIQLQSIHTSTFCSYYTQLSFKTRYISLFKFKVWLLWKYHKEQFKLYFSLRHTDKYPLLLPPIFVLKLSKSTPITLLSNYSYTRVQYINKVDELVQRSY